jgi:SPP1 family predicted phage head-tail adaptor
MAVKDMGELRHWVEVQRPKVSASPDSSGEKRLDRDEDWETVATRWAKIEPLSGREAWLAQQAQSETTHKIELRYLAGLTTRYRVKKGTRRFNLTGVINPGEQRHTTIMELAAVEVPS